MPSSPSSSNLSGFRPGNYWSQACEYLCDLESRSISAKVTGLLDHFDSAPKFALEADGGLLFDVDMDRAAFSDMVRVLPFPRIVVEHGYSQKFHDNVAMNNLKHAARATRNIICCEQLTKAELQASPLFTDASNQLYTVAKFNQQVNHNLLDSYDDDHLFFCVYSIFWLAELQQWHTNPVCLCLPAQGQWLSAQISREGVPVSPENRSAVSSYPEVVIAVYDMLAIAALKDSTDLSHVDLVQKMAENLSPDLLCIVDLILFNATSNVQVIQVPAPAKLNAKRVKKGRRPIDDYNVVTLQRHGADRVQGPDQHGTHASPRMHMRRAHLRRLHKGQPEERLVAVRASVVGAASAADVSSVEDAMGTLKDKGVQQGYEII